MINRNTYKNAKTLFLEGKSLRKISEILNIDRKELSFLLRKEGIKTDKHPSLDLLKEIAKRIINNKEKITKLAIEYKIDRHTLSKHLSENNLYKKKTVNKDKTLDKEINILYKTGLSIEKISEKINKSTNYVWSRINTNDIDFARYNTYQYNDNVFSEIDNEQSAYFLGFLYADGYIEKDGKCLEIALKSEDSYILDDLANYIQTDRPLTEIHVNDKSYKKLYIHNKKIVSNLIKNGCINKKSLIIKFPDFIDKKYMNHFIRGYFDGNGSVILSNHSIIFSFCCASLDFVKSLEEYLKNALKINKMTLTSRKNMKTGVITYNLSKAAKMDVLNFYHYIYNDATIYLTRKKQKFDHFF